MARSFVLGRGAPRARPGADKPRPYENVSITKGRAPGGAVRGPLLPKPRAASSSSFVVTLRQIQAYADEVARRFRPEKIIFFGSHARGRPTVDSDVDLLVIMPHTKRAPYQRHATL